jgi:outer membrane protein TolC
VLSQLNLARESLHRYDGSIVPESRAALEAAHVAYEVDEVDFDGLLTAHSDALEVRLERLNLLREYHRAKAALVELTTNDER